MKGKFRAKAVQWGLGKASTGNEQVGVEFEFADRDGVVHTRWWYGYFTDGTFERTIESLRHCGWEGDDLSKLDGLDKNEVQIVLEEEEYPEGSGQFRDKVRWVNGGSGAGLKEQLSADAQKSFAARMRSRIAAIGKKNGGSKPAASDEPPSFGEKPSGDVPF